MDTAHQPQTPTTPKAFPHEASTATPGGFSPTTGVSASPTNSGSSNTTTLIAIPPTKSHNLYPSSHRPPLHTRRCLQRRRHSPYAYPSSHSYRQSHRYTRFSRLVQPLRPLVSIETGLPHPFFPRSILAYHLLSHTQLDALAAHYHQLTPNAYSLGYPTAVVGRWEARDGDALVRDQHFEALIEEARGALGLVFGCEEETQRVEDKRRRFGRFIGLQCCESPGWEDEGLMRRAMEMWIEKEMDRRMGMDREREGWERKGAW